MSAGRPSTPSPRKLEPVDNEAPAVRRVGRPPSRERWEVRQREVVDAAARVFSDRGYHATSIDDLVRATGLKKGGLYHYIDSKADLLVKIHERFIKPLLEQANAIAEEDLPAEVTLRKLASALMDDIATYRDSVTVFLHEWRIIERDPAWENVRTARAAFEQVIANVLERGIEEGKFEIKNVRLAVLAFLGMINYSYQWYRPSGQLSGQDIADAFCDIFISGIRVEQVKPR